MARKKKPEEHVNHERWMVSYADFITLLFATFTALFAISNADKEKFAAMAKSMKVAFSSGSASSVSGPTVFTEGSGSSGDPVVINIFPDSDLKASKKKESHKTEKEDDSKEPDDSEDVLNGKAMFKSKPAPDAIADEGSNPEKPDLPKAAETDPLAQTTPKPTPTPTPTHKALKPGTEGTGNEAIAQELQQMLNSAGLKGMVDVREEKRGTVISLGEAAFFAPGAVDVYPQSSYQLDKIVNVLRNKNYEIRVEGHTDNTPITSGRFHNNLELSTLRAARIVEFMIKAYRFAPDSLSSAGYGEWRPVAPNTTEASKRKNRRVDIVILNERAASQEPHKDAAVK